MRESKMEREIEGESMDRLPGPARPALEAEPGNIVMSVNRTITVAAAEDLLEASRTGNRRHRPGKGRPRANAGASDEELVFWTIVAISEEYPPYGHRRISEELRRRGLLVNRKRVRRIMREQGICAIPPRRRRIVEGRAAGISAPQYPNLVRGFEVVRPDQVWAADITCIGLETEFVFLAAILDVFTRRCIGWSLGRNGHEGHIMRALRKALRARADKDLTGLVHHSDQGIVYASREYLEFLASRGIQLSMSRRGNPYDNPHVERFFETLKYEDVYLNGYRSFDDALVNIKKFIDDVYNMKRLHSSIGYRPPAEYEKAAAAAAVA
jgi:putative transposase